MWRIGAFGTCPYRDETLIKEKLTKTMELSG